MHPEASVYIDQHNWTLLSSQNWLSRLVNQMMPTDYSAMYRSVAEELQNRTIGREATAAPNDDQRVTLLTDLERRRLRALATADIVAAAPLHAADYWLITPNGSEMTRDDYLGAIESGQLRYHKFEPVSEMAVLGDADVVVLRYQARISFDDGPGITCWHTDCYRLRDGTWQVVWSQATTITALGT